MSVLSGSRRTAAITRLKAAAEAVLKIERERCSSFPFAKAISPRDGLGRDRLQVALEKLEARWRDFPECERDESVPGAAFILAECQRMEREEIADKQFQERMASMRGK